MEHAFVQLTAALFFADEAAVVGWRLTKIDEVVLRFQPVEYEQPLVQFNLALLNRLLQVKHAVIRPSLFEVLIRVFGDVVEDLCELINILIGNALAHSSRLLQHPVVQLLSEPVVQHLIVDCRVLETVSQVADDHGEYICVSVHKNDVLHFFECMAA